MSEQVNPFVKSIAKVLVDAFQGQLLQMSMAWLEDSEGRRIVAEHTDKGLEVTFYENGSIVFEPFGKPGVPVDASEYAWCKCGHQKGVHLDDGCGICGCAAFDFDSSRPIPTATNPLTAERSES